MGKTRKRAAFWPPKYYAGLTRKQKLQRKKEIDKFKKINWKSAKAYKGFKTDTLKKTKRSSYTVQWDQLFPDAKSLKERSKVTGVPERFLLESFNRGMAAWRTGHRVGATQAQWGWARVSSFLLCGKTHYTADADLVRKAKAVSASARKWWARCPTRNPHI
jgi:hypothetical protein